MSYPKTEFIDISGTTLWQEKELLSIPLYTGMKIDIRDKGTYEVIVWHYHAGYDNVSSLRIELRLIQAP